MNLATHRISLDVHDTASQCSISVKRGDTSRKLIVSLVDNGTPFVITPDCYAVFSAVKPNGKVMHNGCTIKDNTIIYEFTEQTTSADGQLDCDLTLYGSDNAQITSPRFCITVFETAVSDVEVDSMDEYKSLENLIKEANNLIYDIETRLVSGAFKGEKGDKGDKGDRGIGFPYATSSDAGKLLRVSSKGDIELFALPIYDGEVV